MLAQTAVRSASFKNTTPPRPPSAENHELGGAVEFMGAPMSFQRNAEIYGEGEPADYLYKVVSGTVRPHTLQEGVDGAGAAHECLGRWAPAGGRFLSAGRRFRARNRRGAHVLRRGD